MLPFNVMVVRGNLLISINGHPRKGPCHLGWGTIYPFSTFFVNVCFCSIHIIISLIPRHKGTLTIFYGWRSRRRAENRSDKKKKRQISFFFFCDLKSMKFLKLSFYYFLSSDMNMRAYVIFYFFLSDRPEQPMSGSVNRRI